MSDIKFSQLTQITDASSLDLVPIIDVSNALMSENGSNAIISIGDLTSSFFNSIGNGSISSAKIQTSPEFLGNVKLPVTTTIGDVNATEIGFLTGLRNNIQYQLDNPVYSGGTLTLGPGTTAGAPLKIVVGALTSTPIAGNIEFNGADLYYTKSNQVRQTLATTTYVDGALLNIIDAAPEALNTLNELAAALGDDANYATTITNSLLTKAPLDSPSFTGNVTFGTGATITLPNNSITGAMIASGTIVDADISTTAAIAGSKITPAFATGDISTTTGSLTIGNATQFESRIGTTVVTPQVQIIALGNDSAGALFGRFSADAAASRHSFIKSRATTKGGHAIVHTGDDLGMIVFGGSDGGKIVEAARIHAEVDIGATVTGGSFVIGKRYRIVSLGNTVWAGVGWVAVPPATSPVVGDIFTAIANGAGTTGTASEEPNVSDMPGRLIFSTTSKGSQTGTERMRITSAGNVGIGTTTPSVKLDVDGGDIKFKNADTGSSITTGESNIRLGYARTGVGLSKLEIYSSAGTTALGKAVIERASGNDGVLTLSDTGTSDIIIHKNNATGNIILRTGTGTPTDRLTVNGVDGSVRLATNPAFSAVGGTQVATTSFVAQSIAAPIIGPVTAGRDLISGDVGKYIRYNGMSAATFTVPFGLTGIIVGSVITFRRCTGAGAITLNTSGAGGGESITIHDNGASSVAAGKTFSIKCIVASGLTREWDFIG